MRSSESKQSLSPRVNDNRFDGNRFLVFFIAVFLAMRNRRAPILLLLRLLPFCGRWCYCKCKQIVRIELGKWDKCLRKYLLSMRMMITCSQWWSQRCPRYRDAHAHRKLVRSLDANWTLRHRDRFDPRKHTESSAHREEDHRADERNGKVHTPNLFQREMSAERQNTSELAIAVSRFVANAVAKTVDQRFCLRFHF